MTVDHEDRSASGKATPSAPAPDTGPASPTSRPAASRRARLGAGIRRLVDAIDRSDDDEVERAVLHLSRRSRWLAPLALIVGAFMMLFQGLKLLLTNWRLTLVQIVPAMWIWLAMLDLKIHVLRGRQFNVLRGPVLVPLFLAVMALTAASFYLNGVFAFAVSKPGKPEIRPAFADANRHLGVISAWGLSIGFALAFSTLVVARWGYWSFAVSLGVVVGIMMLCYLTVPARMVGITKTSTTRSKDMLMSTVLAGVIGAVVCSPPYLLGRLGILMLGWRYLFWFGVAFIVVGVTLQTGVTSAVKAVKFSAKLIGTPASSLPPDPPT